MIALTGWKHSLKRKHNRESRFLGMNSNPFVSVIMPVRNEANYISRSLAAVLAQDYPNERMEILVVDGLSSDGTREFISKSRNKLPAFSIALIDNPEKIVPAGLNAALQFACGEIIVRVDGHTIISPDYIRQCVIALQCSGADNVGGKMNAIGEGRFGESVAIATSSPFGIGGGRFHYSDLEEYVDTVYMGAWPRNVFNRIGLFDEELVRNQDDEFNCRLRSFGGRILLSPKIKSQYVVRSSPHSLWTQYFQYGHWKVRVLQKHPRQMRPRQFVPPAFVASLLLAVFIAIFHPLGRALLVFFGLSYLLADLAAALWAATRRGWRFLPLLPIIFPVLHLSYGLGFLFGLVKFGNRWWDKQGKVPSWSEIETPAVTND